MLPEIDVTDDVSTCQALRREVFMVEQSVPEALELDGLDSDAIHLLARLNGKAVGTARIVLQGDTARIGRVCVLARHRRQGLGAALMRAAVTHLQHREGVVWARLGAQMHAVDFYARLGFRAEGPEYLDAGIAHRVMVLRLRD